jgi:hypothetical protein
MDRRQCTLEQERWTVERCIEAMESSLPRSIELRQKLEQERLQRERQFGDFDGSGSWAEQVRQTKG